jgi:hypothetical protein
MSLDGQKVQSVLATGLTDYSEFNVHEENIAEVKQICETYGYHYQIRDVLPGDKTPYVLISMIKKR